MKTPLFPLRNHYLGTDEGHLFVRYAGNHDFELVTADIAIAQFHKFGASELVCLDKETIGILRAYSEQSKNANAKRLRNKFTIIDALSEPAGILMIEDYLRRSFPLNYGTLPFGSTEGANWIDIMEDPRYHYAEHEDLSMREQTVPFEGLALWNMPTTLLHRNQLHLYRYIAYAEAELEYLRFTYGLSGQDVEVDLIISNGTVESVFSLEPLPTTGTLLIFSTENKSEGAWIEYGGSFRFRIMANGLLPDGQHHSLKAKFTELNAPPMRPLMPAKSLSNKASHVIPLDIEAAK